MTRSWLALRGIGRARRTVRMRLTLVFGGLFLISGASLLAITYALVSSQGPGLEITKASTGGLVAAGPTLARTCFPRSVGESPAPPAGPGLPRSGSSPGLPAGPAGAGPGAVPAILTPGGPAAPGLPAGSGARSQIAGCLAFGQSIAHAQRLAELRQLLIESGVALAIMTISSIGLGWLVAGRAMRPLRSITTTARSISASNLHARLAMSGPDDELKELGDTFDGLLGRLEAAFGAQRQFVANASHELRSPLARQRTLIEVALADPEPSVAALQHLCERLLATGEQTERLIEALLTLARSQRGLDHRDAIDLAAITREVVQARQAEARQRGITMHAGLCQARALGDARLAERLVANLIDNAMRYNITGGTVDVTVGQLDQGGSASPRDGVVLSVANTGPVIAPVEVGRLFQPFQRRGADRVGSRDGFGLGLSIVGAIAQAHGAWLQATALPGGGLAVQVGFPRADCCPAPGSRPATIHHSVASMA